MPRIVSIVSDVEEGPISDAESTWHVFQSKFSLSGYPASNSVLPSVDFDYFQLILPSIIVRQFRVIIEIRRRSIMTRASGGTRKPQVVFAR